SPSRAMKETGPARPSRPPELHSGNGDGAGDQALIDDVPAVVGCTGDHAAEVGGRRSRRSLTGLEGHAQQRRGQPGEFDLIVVEPVAEVVEAVGHAERHPPYCWYGRGADLALGIVDEVAQARDDRTGRGVTDERHVHAEAGGGDRRTAVDVAVLRAGIAV